MNGSVIHARSRWFLAWFSRHVDRRLKRNFGRIRASGLEHLRALPGPVVVVSNHSAWWDPLVAIWLTNRVIAFESFAIMDAANLAQLPFFAKAGAIGVDRSSARDGARVIRHCARLLQASK
ncbi:MAG: 1-acyl-sn-glycerol-3-phosphate acyltransferase, partial [Clostridia bacterium]|nr:1-acyl-sn-glycerol-3-phosphate acyltransferase [Deltaproteobacteria bacterium]